MIGRFVNNKWVQILMFFVTIYALTGDDIRKLAFDKRSDGTFQNSNIITITLLLLEIILSSIGIPNYFLSFLFWIDLISTMSIMMDIASIWHGIMGYDDNG